MQSEGKPELVLSQILQLIDSAIEGDLLQPESWEPQSSNLKGKDLILESTHQPSTEKEKGNLSSKEMLKDNKVISPEIKENAREEREHCHSETKENAQAKEQLNF